MIRNNTILKCTPTSTPVAPLLKGQRGQCSRHASILRCSSAVAATCDALSITSLVARKLMGTSFSLVRKCAGTPLLHRRPYAYYSTRTLFTRCRLLRVTVMNINYQRSPETEHFTTAKISGNALKQRSRTHSVLHQRSSQLQKHKTARMSRRIAVDQKVCGGDGGLPALTV